MENQMMLKTRAAAQEMNEWLKKTRDAENARLMDAENLLEMLGSCDTVMTPGYCVCRSIQIHYPEVLEGLDCPDLNKSGRETGWSANVCKKVCMRTYGRVRMPTVRRKSLSARRRGRLSFSAATRKAGSAPKMRSTK